MQLFVKQALQFIYSRFYSPQTHLIYDYTADPKRNVTKFLPAREQSMLLSYPFQSWDQVTPLEQGKFDGILFRNPAQSENSQNRAFYPVREVGEGAVVAAICPKRLIKPELLTAVEQMLCAFDYDHYYSVYGPLLLSCAYALCCENMQSV